ncbi:GH36 C-terminal domain-containing protein [Actinokineospora sp. UTMC 2448]|uniref:GH36 C-terminal domain-containing protein n=1 Tax=Actinokineospora sp. UTMC 2448 TaxID=2268449 RepID=UPI002868B3EB|nr:GH36 C-terminal domain-containing protein [Actinokineospora sp. UTMC 2448]
MSDVDRARLAEWVALYKELRGLLHSGVSVHSGPVHGVVAADGSDAVFAIVATGTSELYPPGPVRLPGLDPEATYHVRPLPPGDIADGNATDWGVPLPWWTPTGVTLRGRALTAGVLQAPVLYPERLVLIRATEV